MNTKAPDSECVSLEQVEHNTEDGEHTTSLEQVNHESLRQRIGDEHVSVVNTPDSELEQVEHNTEDGEHTVYL